MSGNSKIKMCHHINHVANCQEQRQKQILLHCVLSWLHSSLLHFIDRTDIYESAHNFISN